MKPFYTKVLDERLRLVFAYQYLTLLKNDEVFQFIPIEGKEIIINMETLEIENLSEVFVFQKGNRFLRVPLYQLMLMPNVQEHLAPILEQVTNQVEEFEIEAPAPTEMQQLIHQFEVYNYNYFIDKALDDKDEALFNKLVAEKKQLEERLM